MTQDDDGGRYAQDLRVGACWFCSNKKVPFPLGISDAYASL